MTRKHTPAALLILLFGSLAFLGACDDDHEHEYHHAPIGVVLSIDNSMIAVQEGNNMTYADGDAISIPSGGATETINIQFLDDEGTHFTPDGSEESLGYTIGNTEILDVTHPVDNDQWSFRLNGIEAGSTTIQFDLMHGGHSDFTSREFQVTVE
ncbi:MAG: hypothetical protein ACQETM_01640 [Bacteroidota bacterium]